MSNVRPHKRNTVAISKPAIRLMTEVDVPMLHAWLHKPHVAEWWAGEEGLSLEEAKAKYLPRVMAADRVTPYIATLDGQPIGYAQSYVALGSGGGWWEDEIDPGVRGIDQFLSEASMLGQGLGASLVIALVELLFRDPAVTKIQTDPDPTNLRAIRCYEKAGFKAVRTVATPDGPALYMLKHRVQAQAPKSAA